MKIIKNFVEKIMSKILARLKTIPELNISKFDMIQYFDKNKINILYINTGLMPRFKSEEFCKNLEDKIKRCNPDYKFVIIPHSNNLSINKTVYQLDEDNLNIVYIPVGRMPKSKSEECLKIYLKQINELIEDKTKNKFCLIALCED